MLLKQTFTEFFPPRPALTETGLPSLSGKVYLITGGAAGIGKELSRMLFTAGATVYIAGRSRTNIKRATKDIVENPVQRQDAVSTSAVGRIVPVVLDLADLRSIKPAIEELKQQTTKIDVAFMNAGVMVPPLGSQTKQGYELQWGTNVVGHLLLQQLLLPLLLASAKENGEARIIWTSSDGSNFSPSPDGIYWNNINGANLKPWNIYTQSKAGNVIIAAETARRYGNQNIVTTSLNPGHLKTELQRHSNACVASIVKATLLYGPQHSALTELFAGISEKASTENNGKYFIPWGREGKMAKYIERGLKNGSRADFGNCWRRRQSCIFNYCLAC